ncbi:MAG: metallophosphoesterase [Fimbriimonadaceae bacterium]|nr:metallophosphoesterase [Fimbriimonadaceae bacterium]
MKRLAASLAFAVGLAGAATFAYGVAVGRRRLVLRDHALAIPDWPPQLNGLRIALVADFHLKNRVSGELSHQAIALAIRSEPDVLVLAGDFVDRWYDNSPGLVDDLLTPLAALNLPVIAVPGNHDYFRGTPDALAESCARYGIHWLVNASVTVTTRRGEVQFLGLDSARFERGEPERVRDLDPDIARIVVWHEPDAVDQLPAGAHLMLSGHSHGGQFVFPGGFAPVHSKLGRRYVRGYYPQAPTPIFVTPGVGTTFLPARLNCPPEVSRLTLRRA